MSTPDPRTEAAKAEGGENVSEPICTCHCGGSMFYRHMHAQSCELSRVGEEAPKTSPVTCAWYRDGEDSDAWATSCKHIFMLNDGETPSDCKWAFCPYCGKSLEVHL